MFTGNEEGIMKRSLLLTLLLAGAVIGFQALPTEQPPEFTVPEGFIVEEVLAPDVAVGAVSMTFDAEGNLALGREEREIVVFLDEDNDGTFEEERVFTDQLHEAQGLIFDGPDLLAVAEDADENAGLFRVYDDNGDHRGDRVEMIAHIDGSLGDHGPHQLYWGPDGLLYMSIGNSATLFEPFDPMSPQRRWSEATLEVGRTLGHGSDYRTPGSIVIRRDMSDPDADWQLFASGMRNHYESSFNMMGELFAFDSDLEYDRDLPWYVGVSSIHLIPGGDVGWRSGSMKHPNYYLDNNPRTEDQGRGSPTGTHFYQGYNYPEEYYDMFLQSDWSRGRIIMSFPERAGATYSLTSDNFVFGMPLNVTDVETGPDGNLYFALGGRETAGGVYRVVYTGSDAMGAPEAGTPIEQVLTMHSPRMEYQRQFARDVKEEIGETAWQQGLTAVVRDTQADPMRRVRAMELLHAFGPGLDLNTLATLDNDPSWEVRAHAAYFLGMQSDAEDAQEALLAYFNDSDPMVQRRAAEAMLRTGIHRGTELDFDPAEVVLPLLSNEDRHVRLAGRILLREIRPSLWWDAAMQVDGFPGGPEVLLAIVESMPGPLSRHMGAVVARQLELLRTNPTGDDMLAIQRSLQRSMLADAGVVYDEYEEIGQLLLGRFPTGDWRVDRETARMLAYLEPSGAAQALAAQLASPEAPDYRVVSTANTSTTNEQQLAYADALAYIETGWDETAMDQLVNWIETSKQEGWRGGRYLVNHIDVIGDLVANNLPPELAVEALDRIEAASAQQPMIASLAGTGAAEIDDESAQEIADDLIYNPGTFGNNPELGAWAFEKSFCINCHTFGPIGTEFGPDLTTIGQRFNRADLVNAIMFPSDTISELWASVQITRTNGEVLLGSVLSEDGQSVTIQIAAGPAVTVPRSEIESMVTAEVSAMPPGLIHFLDGDEQSALLALLAAGPSAIPDTALARINNR
jgi:putative heme-binding domain-containing protein